MSVSICQSVCLSTCMSHKPHVQTSRNVLFIVARSPSEDKGICYVLSVLWTTSWDIWAKWRSARLGQCDWRLCVAAPDDVMFDRVRQVAAPVGGCQWWRYAGLCHWLVACRVHYKSQRQSLLSTLPCYITAINCDHSCCHCCCFFVSDIAIFVLKRDVKLQLTN